MKRKVLCKNCGIEFETWDCRLKIGKSKYCSKKCSRIGKHPSTEFKKGNKTWNTGLKGKGIIKANKGSFQKGLIPWNKDSKGVVKSWIKKGKTYEQLYGIKRAKEIKKKIGIKSLGRTHKFVPTPEQIRKMLIIHSPNKDEQYVNHLLQQSFPHEWKFVGDGKVIIENKNPDFININGKKIIIELFGKYWHKKEEEQTRINTFAKYGYKTLIIWNYELKNEKLILERIKKLYTEESYLNITRT